MKEKEIVGFACYDTTNKCFFGPTGVDEQYRGKGIGKALLLKSLEGLWNLGYAYGIIGSVGPADFYKKTCDAVIIENSTPGIYANLL
jgi:predicted N-acetyltransferase YhbS